MLVSFVVPAYNESHRVADILDSIRRQTHPWVELIFVDDGSSDGTLDHLLAQTNLKRVSTVRHPNPSGVAAARNSGARIAAGDVQVFMDADLSLPDDFAARILAHYAAGADYVLVGSRVADRSRAPSRYLQSEHELALAKPELQRSSQAFSVRRHVYHEVGGFREGLPRGDDSEFGERVMAAGYRRVEDLSIEVLHDRPKTWVGFLALQRRRGRNFAYSRRIRRGHGVVHLLVAALARTVLHGGGDRHPGLPAAPGPSPGRPFAARSRRPGWLRTPRSPGSRGAHRGRVAGRPRGPDRRLPSALNRNDAPVRSGANRRGRIAARRRQSPARDPRRRPGS